MRQIAYIQATGTRTQAHLVQYGVLLPGHWQGHCVTHVGLARAPTPRGNSSVYNSNILYNTIIVHTQLRGLYGHL